MKRLLLVLLFALPAFGQFSQITNGPPVTCPGYRTTILDQIDNWVYTCASPASGPSGTPVPQLVGRVTQSGSVLPTKCSSSPLETFGLVSGGITTPYYCSAPNVWTAFGAGGGGPDSVQTISGSQTLGFGGATNSVVSATAGVSGITLTLPDATASAGKTLRIVMVDAGVGGVLLSPVSAQTIGGLTSYKLLNQWQYVQIQSNNANWLVTASGQVQPWRSVPSLPATCSGGSSALYTDTVVLVTSGQGTPYFCVSPNTWQQFTVGSSGLGPISSGFIPVAGPGISPTLINSSLIDNGSVVRTGEPMQAASFTATAPNIGLDLTEGTGKGLNLTAGHDYIYGNSTLLCPELVQNGVDTLHCLTTNPVQQVYHVDGFTYPTLCGLIQSLPAHTIATIYEDVLETQIPCDPGNQGSTVTVNFAKWNAAYTFCVPLRTGPNEYFIGAGRGLSGSTIKGTILAPDPTCYANPYVSTTPSGFTIGNTTSGCGGHFPAAGTYLIEVTWGPDTTRETTAAQETSVTVDGATQCFKVTPPVSPPSPVTVYDVYGCQVAGCSSGQELWQAQNLISVATTYGQFQTGNGKPPTINNTGAFITIGNANGPQGNAVSTQATFGTGIRNLSITCAANGCVPVALLTGEEGSGIFETDIQNIGTSGTPGAACIIWEGYGNIGEAGDNSRIRDFTCNAAQSGGGDPTVAEVYLDQLTSVRGIDGFTITPTASTTPVCILVNGTTTSPVGGTLIENGHMEKCPDGIETINGHNVIINMSCSPANVTRCVHFDSASTNSVAMGIRGGSSDAAVQDDVTGFASTQGFVGFFTNGSLEQQTLLLGQPPTCTATGLGTGGTPGCSVQTGGSNSTGTINLTTGTTALTAAANGTFSLIFSGPGFGVNQANCTYKLLNVTGGGGLWNARATVIGSASGTGHDDNLWDNNSAALLNTHQYSIVYNCGPS